MRSLDAVEVTAVQGLTDIATIAIIQYRITIDAQKLNSQLSEALNSRITIEQAKGKISQAANVDMDRAFRCCASTRGHNLRLSELATDVAAGTLKPTASTQLFIDVAVFVAAQPFGRSVLEAECDQLVDLRTSIKGPRGDRDRESCQPISVSPGAGISSAAKPQRESFTPVLPL